MSTANTSDPLVAEPELGVALRLLGVDADALRPAPPGAVPRPITRWLAAGNTGRLLVEVAHDHEGRRRLSCETSGRAWAREAGVPTPPVVASAPSGGWLVSVLGGSARPDEAWVEEAFGLADRIQTAVRPPLDPTRSTWRAPARSRTARVTRAVLGGVPPVRFRQARRDYEALGDRAACHGDFYHRNLVGLDNPVGLPGRCAVVDWEFLGTAPRFTDHVRLWSVLTDDLLRARTFDRLVGGRGAEERLHLGVVVAWLGLRLLAENLAAPVARRSTADLAHARRVADESIELARWLRGGRP